MRFSNANEAFHWWNSTIGSSNNDSLSPQIPSMDKAKIVWKQYFPFIILKLDDNNNQQISVYWNEVFSIFENSFNINESTNPTNHFPEFVIFLYKLLPLLRPKTASNYINFFNIVKYNNFARFFLYELPFYFNDPLVYFRSIGVMCNLNHNIWKHMISSNETSNGFINLYLNFLQPNENQINVNNWEHHLLIGDIIFQILFLTLRFNPLTITNSNKFADILMKLIPLSPSAVQSTLTRWVLLITKKTLKKNEKDITRQRVKSFISLIKIIPTIRCYSICFIKKNFPSFTSVTQLINSISVDSLASIDLVLGFTTKYGPMPSIIKLAKAALSSKIWHRASFQAIFEILLAFPNNIDLKDWFAIFMRRLFLFIVLANVRNKYKTRSLLITETLSRLFYLKIGWINQILINVSYSIHITRVAPIYFSGFFPLTGQIDEPTLNEFESFQRFVPLCNLKTFPFDGNKSSFLHPPPVEINNNNNQGLVAQPLIVHPPSNSQQHHPNRVRLCKAKQNKKQAPTTKGNKKKQLPVIKKPKAAKAKKRH